MRADTETQATDCSPLLCPRTNTPMFAHTCTRTATPITICFSHAMCNTGRHPWTVSRTRCAQRARLQCRGARDSGRACRSRSTTRRSSSRSVHACTHSPPHLCASDASSFVLFSRVSPGKGLSTAVRGVRHPALRDQCQQLAHPCQAAQSVVLLPLPTPVTISCSLFSVVGWRCNDTVSTERERDVCVAREILATLQHCFVKKSDVTTLTAPTHQSAAATRSHPFSCLSRAHACSPQVEG